nr:replication initiator [Kineococcus xinjiangensis]
MLGEDADALGDDGPDNATVVEDAESWLLLVKWLHMLGFRGHFSTRSRRYSVTLGSLHEERRTWWRRQRGRRPPACSAPPSSCSSSGRSTASAG